MTNNRMELIRQALGAAESSIKLAKQLLNELESGKGGGTLRPNPEHDRPGVIGIYDGEKMTTDTGENYPVPANYASKSLLVVGDTLKLVEENGDKRFKQIEHVKRHKTSGMLVKKEGKFRVITPEGSYKVLSEAVTHFNGDVGDEVSLYLPAGNLTSPYGAIETMTKKGKLPAEPSPAAPVVEPLEETPKKEVNKSEETKKPKPKAPEPTPLPKPRLAPEKPTPPKVEVIAPKPATVEAPVPKEPAVETPVPEASPSAEANGEDELS